MTLYASFVTMITARTKRGRSYWRSLKALERLIPIRVAQIIWHTLKSLFFTTSPIALLFGAGLNPNIQFSNDNNLYGSREVMRFSCHAHATFHFLVKTHFIQSKIDGAPHHHIIRLRTLAFNSLFLKRITYFKLKQFPNYFTILTSTFQEIIFIL